MASIKLKYVQAFMARGRRFYYFRKPGSSRVRLPGLPGSAEFNQAYEAALADAPRVEIGARRTIAGTVNAAIVAYYASAHFEGLSPAQQRFRRNVIEAFRQERGDRPIKLLAQHHVVAMMERIKKPHARKNWLKAIRPMLQHAHKIGLIAVDPTIGIKTKLPKSDGFRTWGEAEIQTFCEKHPVGTKARLALELLLGTCQRRGDVIRMGPAHVRAGKIEVKQSKTGVSLKIPVLPDLAAAIAATPTGIKTFLVGDSGERFTDDEFGRWFRIQCDAAGLQSFSAHGLRKAACVRLAEHGCTEKEIAAWSGHKTLGEVARYTQAAEQERLADAAAFKLRTKSRDSGVKQPRRKVSNAAQDVETKRK